MQTRSILSLVVPFLLILGWSSAQAASAAALPLGPKEFRDCPDCPRMVRLPAGTFQMGDASPRVPRDEKPVHAVALPAFAVGAFEVTRGEYAAFVAAAGYSPLTGCQSDRGLSGAWRWDPTASWRDPGYPQTDQEPVVCIAWKDAEAYTAWLGQKTGKAYRLLSEAEWEYAARAGTTTQYWWGDKPDDMCPYANGPDQAVKAKYPAWPTVACDDGRPFTATVGSYRANAFGLYDMAGNAWEWTGDCYQPYEALPKGFTETGCGLPALRGGSWGYSVTDLRPATRNALDPRLRGADIGFRVARSL